MRALLLVALALALTSCNQQIFDFEWKFTKAYCKWPDGSFRVIEVEKWNDYADSDQLQVIGKDGNVYLFHAANVVLVNE
jgi:hypothetical protein